MFRGRWFSQSPMMLAAVFSLFLAFCLSGTVYSTPVVDATSTPELVEFTSKNTDAQIRAVKNSGVCETTPGVNQMSGYIDIGTNMSMV